MKPTTLPTTFHLQQQLVFISNNNYFSSPPTTYLYYYSYTFPLHDTTGCSEDASYVFILFVFILFISSTHQDVPKTEKLAYVFWHDPTARTEHCSMFGCSMLGKGQFGTVYKALRARLPDGGSNGSGLSWQPVALKISRGQNKTGAQWNLVMLFLTEFT